MAGESSSSSSSGTERKLDQTPTWALAGLCAVMIIISISLEKTLHKLGTSFRERHKKALFEALEKVKSELMVLGFISLLLTFGQKYIAKICIPTKVADTMLPCPATETTTTSTEGGHQRRLLWYQHQILAADNNNFKCEDGKVPLISFEGMTQLHILIFFLAVIHVLYSAVTMTLGRLKGVSVAVIKSRSNGNEEWDLSFRRALFQWELEELRRMKVLLQNAPELRNGVLDRLFWDADRSGTFTVSSAYKWKESPSTMPAKVVDLIWKNAAPPKAQFLAWLAWKGRIKTAMYLHRIGILGANSDVNCVFCRNDRETVSHVLLCCTFSWRVWSHIIGWWGVSWVQPGSVDGLIHWWTGFRCHNRLKAIWRIIPLAVLWSLWKQRNEIIFNEAQLDLEKLCDLIKTRIALWFRASSPYFHYSVDDLVFNLQNVKFCIMH